MLRLGLGPDIRAGLGVFVVAVLIRFVISCVRLVRVTRELVGTILDWLWWCMAILFEFLIWRAVAVRLMTVVARLLMLRMLMLLGKLSLTVVSCALLRQ